MSARERLESYLHSLRVRLRTHIYARAAAVAIGGVLAVTALTVWTLQRREFAPAITIAGRVAIGVLIVGVVVALLWRPLRRLGRDQGAHIFEERLPDENGRIQTYLDSKRRESQGNAPALLSLLAADAVTIAERTPPHEIVSSRRIAAGVLLAGAALVVLGALLVAGTTYWGFGSRHLLLGMELPRNAVPLRRVTVTPGNATVRRNSDLAIQAAVEGFHPRDVQVFVRFADRQDWERAPMQPAEGQEARFEFRLYAVRAPLQYYVDAEGTRSGEHNVTVVDLPRIERVQLTYEYPQWTGLDPKVDDASRDISAVEGTNVKVEVVADGPLDAPALIVNGQTGELAQQGRTSTGAIVVTKPGRYQIGARVANEFVALSDEYAIEVVPDEKPTIEIRKPGRDWRATSIEEVPVRIRAEDDFRLRDVSLHYSVNGGAWQAVPVGGGAKSSEGEPVLDLEQLGATQAKSADKRLEPGDLVSYYAVAKDRKQAAQTDLFMVQVQPFERRFLQAQSGNNDGGAMADEQGAISERQREILLATWNLQRSDERGARTQQQLEDSAKMLAELQATLAQQARTLAQRTRARASLEEDERIRTFVESLERAATVMDPAIAHLNTFKLPEAVPFEQQALQQLLRAESAFREVQVSMQQSNAGGDGSQTARNFTEMFELEMDLEKSQYESESQLASRNTQKDIDEMIRKLKELAERQERLAQERQQDLRMPEQRWKQEQLRREAEDLRRRLAELNRQQQQSGDSQASRGGSSSGQAREREERQREQLSQALESVNKALQDMQSANGQSADNNSGGDPRQAQQSGQQSGQQSSQQSAQQAQQAAEQASRNLRRALQQIDRPEPSHFDEALEQFADRSQQMLEEQRRIESELYEALSQPPPVGANGRGGIDQKRAQELVRSKQQMASDLTNLERDMRNAVHENRKDHPKTTQRLSDIIRDVEGSDLMYRLNRSAAEIYYGRARQAAPSEGLTTDALDTLEQDLREAAAQAGEEGKGKREDVTAEALLAQVAELRRALQDAQSQSGENGERGEQGDNSEQGQQGQGQQGENGQNSQRGREGREGQGGGERAAENGRGGQPPRGGLSAWSPNTPTVALGGFENGNGSLARQTARIGERIRDLANRMNRGDLSQAELEALRRAATQLRRLSGDPLSAQPDVMLKLIDQIELQALASNAKSREAAAARATLPDPDSPNYREAVAEYYRRLGDR
ncbi:MAG TPA: hypothetical protein VJT10_09910 [Steroidobacteraceae bacterium]|nr:hypothetical protein [Steroidobacteraceae bacterium]